MKLRIGLIGSTGKVGRQISILIEKEPKMVLTWTLNSQSDRKNLLPVDVIVDFSSPQALERNLSLAQEQKTPIVIGTTGLDAKQQNFLELTSKQIPIFWAPNFSLGIAAITHIIEMLSPILQENFTATITETHHIHKKDSPSGSAIALAKAALTGYTNPPLIKSIRFEEVIGEHSISFIAKDEKITLSHEVLSREVFAKGALQAAQFILHKPAKLYGMKDLLH